MKQSTNIVGSLSRRPAVTLAGLVLVIASAFFVFWAVLPDGDAQPSAVNRESVAEPSEPSSTPQLVAGGVLLGGWAAAGAVMFWNANRRRSESKTSDQQSEPTLEHR